MQKTKYNKFLLFLRSIPSISWILVFMVGIFIVIIPYFGTIDNAFNIMRQGAVLIIVAMGMMMVISSGGIDLSVGSLVGLSGTLTAFLIAKGIIWYFALLIGISACSLIGLINGLVISRGQIFPFVVTFGMLFVAQSISLGFSQGGSIHIDSIPFSIINYGYFLMFPIPFWIMAGLILLIAFIMKRTVIGRYIFAIGNDATSASWMGINVDLYRMVVYLISGTLAGIAGVILASRVRTGNALIGQYTNFFAIAAVVIGGTPITGGRGSFLGAAIGALVITVLQNGLTLFGLSSELITTIVGITLMAGVILAQMIFQGGLRGNN